jgi:hypothetical protein
MEYININRVHADRTGTVERQQQRTKTIEQRQISCLGKAWSNKKGATQGAFLLAVIF